MLMVRLSGDQPSLKLRPDKGDATQCSPAGAGFAKPSLLDFQKMFIKNIDRISRETARYQYIFGDEA